MFNLYASSKFPGITDAIFQAENGGTAKDWERVKKQISMVVHAIRTATSLLQPYSVTNWILATRRFLVRQFLFRKQCQTPARLFLLMFKNNSFIILLIRKHVNLNGPVTEEGTNSDHQLF